MKVYLGCFVICSVACCQLKAQGLDFKLLNRLNPNSHKPDNYWLQTSNSAYAVAPTYTMGNMVYGLLYKDKKAFKNGFETTLSVGLGIALSGGIKTLVNRDRPTQAHPDHIYSYTYSEGKSFPSGHTTLAFATATSIALQCKKWYITVPAYAWAASVGYSRMRLGRHYPSDVATGAALGIATGYLSHWVTKKILK